jgi:excisionase family DNA binding protein
MTALKPPTRMLTLPQVAGELGTTVNTVRSWVYRRRIAFVKIGRSVRVSEATVQRIIERGTIPAEEDLQQ